MRVIYDVSYVSYADAYFLSETLSQVISIYDYVEFEASILRNIKSCFSVFVPLSHIEHTCEKVVPSWQMKIKDIKWFPSYAGNK